VHNFNCVQNRKVFLKEHIVEKEMPFCKLQKCSVRNTQHNVTACSVHPFGLFGVGRPVWCLEIEKCSLRNTVENFSTFERQFPKTGTSSHFEHCADLFL
jgi:hypothetical protein